MVSTADNVEKARPRAGSPHTGVEVDIHVDAAGIESRLSGAGEDTLEGIGRSAGGLSSDEAHSESKDGENRRT